MTHTFASGTPANIKEAIDLAMAAINQLQAGIKDPATAPGLNRVAARSLLKASDLVARAREEAHR